jgi:hypothetical protein
MKRKVLLLVMATVLLVPLLGCSSAAVRCDVTSNSPHQSKRTPDDIVGKARYGCTATVESVTTTVKLQQMTSGKWVDVAVPKPDTVPAPVAGKKYTIQAVLKCRAGTFHTASRGYGSHQGRRARSTVWDYSPAVEDPCG